MYGKTYNLHSSPALAPTEPLLVSSSPAFDGLHNDIKMFTLACFYRKLLKKRRPHGEREPTIVDNSSSTEKSNLPVIYKGLSVSVRKMALSLVPLK